MTTQDQRAAFEAHFRKPPFEWEPHRYGDQSAWPGNYQNYDMQCAWEGWQAAIEHDRKGQGEAVAWPRNAKEIRDFIDTHFISMTGGDEASDDDKYLLTAHDLLSAFDWWTDFAPQPAEPVKVESDAEPVCWWVTWDADNVGVAPIRAGLYMFETHEAADKYVSKVMSLAKLDAKRPAIVPLYAAPAPPNRQDPS